MGVYFVIHESKRKMGGNKAVLFIRNVQNKEIVGDSLMIYTSDRSILRILCLTLCIVCCIYTSIIGGN
jgi:hypothetical protein